MYNVIIYFWDFFFLRGNKASLALFPERKKKSQKWIILQKLRVPMSEGSVLFATPAQIQATFSHSILKIWFFISLEISIAQYIQFWFCMRFFVIIFGNGVKFSHYWPYFYCENINLNKFSFGIIHRYSNDTHDGATSNTTIY